MRFNWKIFRKDPPELSPEEGYSLWSADYERADNLMQQLDRQLVEELLASLDLSARTILDFGCGTGRHWPLLFRQSAARLLGTDTSPEMLAQLRKKYPRAEVFLLTGPSLFFQGDLSVDLIFSTLTIGHVPDLQPVIAEWNRVLKPGGHLILTGNHPEALKAGIKRSFTYRRNTYHIRNHLHELETIRTSLTEVGWEEAQCREIRIGDEHRAYFEKAGALESLQFIKGTAVIYGMCWRKPALP